MHFSNSLKALGFLVVGSAAAAQSCPGVDFLTLPLGSGDPVEVAVEAAYPGSDVDWTGGIFRAPDGTPVPIAPARAVGPAERLEGATFGDMYVYPYPLAFDLTQREVPWNDPGRVRNDAWFRALYGASEAEVRGTLVRAPYEAGVTARFTVTTRQCVATQLQLALDEIETLGLDPFFESIGGSFNWRVIAGTDRLSSHSFGAAVDFNTDLGGYWRWSGEPEGAVGPYANRTPEALVRAMERRGFIWGGKWHHYDGMHFEYRPDLILLARLL